MGELVDLDKHRKRADLMQSLDQLYHSAHAELPPPESFGWHVIESVNGAPVRWYQPRYHATLGYVPGDPGQIHLSYRDHDQTWSDLTIEELIVGLELGTLSVG